MSEDSSKSVRSQHSANITWGPIAAILVTIITYLASQFLVGFGFSVIFGFLDWSDSRIREWLDTTFAQFLVVGASGIASLLVLRLFLDMRKSGLRMLGLSRLPNLKDLAFISIGFAIYFGLLIVASLLAAGVGVDTQQEQNVGFESAKEAGNNLLLVFISLVILPPIVEEILFRGFLFAGLRTTLKFVQAAILASVLFAIPHLAGSESGLLWIAAIDTFVLSLVLCYVREKTGALWSSMGIHAMKNGLAFVFLFVAVQ